MKPMLMKDSVILNPPQAYEATPPLRRCEKIGLGKGDGSKVEKFRLNLEK
jgi:hypothetical protein